MKKAKQNNIVKFPNTISDVEKEIEAVLLSKDTQGLPYHTNHLADDNSPMYPWHRDESWSVSQYNRNRPAEEHVQSVEEITRGLDEEG